MTWPPCTRCHWHSYISGFHHWQSLYLSKNFNGPCSMTFCLLVFVTEHVPYIFMYTIQEYTNAKYNSTATLLTLNPSLLKILKYLISDLYGNFQCSLNQRVLSGIKPWYWSQLPVSYTLYYNFIKLCWHRFAYPLENYEICFFVICC